VKISSNQGYLDIRLSEDGVHVEVLVAAAEFFPDGKRKELKVNSIKVRREDFEQQLMFMYKPAGAGEREDTNVDQESFTEDGN
jgi:hypothetical protein